MVSIPIFEQLSISEYGLYPGSEDSDPGLNIKFRPGLTLVIGANGLGKSTLVAVLYRMLTGPKDIPSLSKTTDVGGANLDTKNLRKKDSHTFGARVADGAANARSTLKLRLAKSEIALVRKLSDLSLTEFFVDGVPNNPADFESKIVALAGLNSFSDWILMLRHLVFYFEDRKALVWDATAQRQLLRLLFLSKSMSDEWVKRERAILKLDSSVRNLRFAIGREEKDLAETESLLTDSADIRAELKTLEELRATDKNRLEAIDDSVVDAENERNKARTNFLKLELEAQSAHREVEHARLSAISAHFPTRSETARYILAQLMTEDNCLVCGNNVPEASVFYQERLEAAQCVICGSLADKPKEVIPSQEVARKRLAGASKRLATLETQVTEGRRRFESAVREYEALKVQADILGEKLSERSSRISALIRRLPPDEDGVLGGHLDIQRRKKRLNADATRLKKDRDEFNDFAEKFNRSIAKKSSEVKSAFEEYARGFLFEDCQLIWSPVKVNLGQTGEQVDSPAFDLEMTGSDFASAQRRNGPEQVSESQREFIDLSFRMALMKVAGTDGTGSLVIDAPESSLDAVFVSRAADVLAKFSKPSSGNRLVVTSNLVDGRLLPELLNKSTPKAQRKSRVVDLFKIAEPTAAIRHHRDEYASAQERILEMSTGDQK